MIEMIWIYNFLFFTESGVSYKSEYILTSLQ